MSKARVRWGGLVVVLAGLLLLSRTAVAEDFTVPPALRPTVDFWISIFATYGKRQILIHDTDHVDRVYSVIDFSDLDQEGVSEGEIEGAMKNEEEAEKERVRTILRRLDTVDPRSDPLTEEEQR